MSRGIGRTCSFRRTCSWCTNRGCRGPGESVGDSKSGIGRVGVIVFLRTNIESPIDSGGIKIAETQVETGEIQESGNAETLTGTGTTSGVYRKLIVKSCLNNRVCTGNDHAARSQKQPSRPS